MERSFEMRTALPRCAHAAQSIKLPTHLLLHTPVVTGQLTPIHSLLYSSSLWFPQATATLGIPEAAELTGAAAASAAHAAMEEEVCTYTRILQTYLYVYFYYLNYTICILQKRASNAFGDEGGGVCLCVCVCVGVWECGSRVVNAAM